MEFWNRLKNEKDAHKYINELTDEKNEEIYMLKSFNTSLEKEKKDLEQRIEELQEDKVFHKKMLIFLIKRLALKRDIKKF